MSDFRCFTGLKTSQEAVWRPCLACGRMAWRPTFSSFSLTLSEFQADAFGAAARSEARQAPAITSARVKSVKAYWWHQPANHFSYNMFHSIPFHFRFLWMSSWANYCLDDSQLSSSHPPKVLCNSDLIHQHGSKNDRVHWGWLSRCFSTRTQVRVTSGIAWGRSEHLEALRQRSERLKMELTERNNEATRNCWICQELSEKRPAKRIQKMIALCCN